MRSWLAIMALAAVVLVPALSDAPRAAEGDGRPSTPQRSTEERPFGGPPPNMRGLVLKKAGTKCKTAAATCQLEKARPVGAACTCPGDGTAQGKVE